MSTWVCFFFVTFCILSLKIVSILYILSKSLFIYRYIIDRKIFICKSLQIEMLRLYI